MNVLATLFAYLASAQTVYEVLPSESFFNLSITDDGRIEAKIRGGDYYGEGDQYHNVYRNFLEINRDTGTLLVSFAAARWLVDDDSHIITVTIPSGATVTSPPRNATFPKAHWYNDNHILWYDQKEKAFVMIFQEGCYSCLDEYDYDWVNKHGWDALNQTIFKTMSYDDGITWQGKVELLAGSGVVNPHVQYQIIPGFDTDDEGYAIEVMIPIHHLDEDDPDSNFQMLWRTNRAMDPNDGSWRVVNMSDSQDDESVKAHIQTTIVRPKEDANLVAFLRDRNGHWLHRTTSADDGKTWTNQKATPLANPDTMSQAIALHNGKIMLFHNPQQSFGSWPTADRDDNAHIMAISISENEGLSWTHERVLEYFYDTMTIYPTALQDPTCDNIYLAWSLSTNDVSIGVGCDVALSDEAYAECVETSVSLDFIKFTVIHETWVLDNHNWQLDYEGCAWNIAETLQEQISEIKYSQATGSISRFLTSAVLSDAQMSSDFIWVFIVVIVGQLFCTAGICYYSKSASRNQ